MKNSTIDFYDKNAENYASSTFNVDVSSVRTQFLKQIPIGGKILDAGCGSGRDALAFKNAGYLVKAFDASEELSKIASSNAELPVLHMTFEEMKWNKSFDGVWCMASLLHLNDNELKSALKKCSEALVENGKFFGCFKTGEGASLDDKGRFFNYQSEQKLKDVLEESGLFKNVKFFYNSDSLGRQDTLWINVLADSNKPELKLERKRSYKI